MKSALILIMVVFQLIDSEGELEYTPLVRPENYKPYPVSPPSPMSMNVQDDHTDESEHEPSSDPDSDSDECNNRPKRRKLKFKRHRKSECSESTKNNKYNVWSKTFVVNQFVFVDRLIKIVQLCSMPFFAGRNAGERSICLRRYEK